MGLFRRRETPRPGNTTAVILAGGRSSRFGSTKGLATLQGRPLVRWAAQLAAAVSSETIIVVAPDEEPERWRRAVGEKLPTLAMKGKKETSLEVLQDDRPYSGPVGGIEAALPRLEAPFVLLLAVDMPLLRPDLALGLNERLGGHDAVAYHLDGWWRPFPSLWKRDALKLAVRRAATEDERSVHGLLDRVDARPLGREFLALFDVEGSALQSVNTREDLEAVAARLAGPAG